MYAIKYKPTARAELTAARERYGAAFGESSRAWLGELARGPQTPSKQGTIVDLTETVGGLERPPSPAMGFQTWQRLRTAAAPMRAHVSLYADSRQFAIGNRWLTAQLVYEVDHGRGLLVVFMLNLLRDWDGPFFEDSLVPPAPGLADCEFGMRARGPSDVRGLGQYSAPPGGAAGEPLATSSGEPGTVRTQLRIVPRPAPVNEYAWDEITYQARRATEEYIKGSQ